MNPEGAAMHRHRLTRSAALGLALAALVGTTGYAQAQDLRSPDSREAGPTGQAPPLPAYPTPALGAQDLRTPDSRDAGEGRGTFSAPEVVFVRVPQRSSAAGAVDWRDAGIGAGTVAVLALALGASLVVLRRRHPVTARRHAATTG